VQAAQPEAAPRSGTRLVERRPRAALLVAGAPVVRRARLARRALALRRGRAHARGPRRRKGARRRRRRARARDVLRRRATLATPGPPRGPEVARPPRQGRIARPPAPSAATRRRDRGRPGPTREPAAQEAPGGQRTQDEAREARHLAPPDARSGLAAQPPHAGAIGPLARRLARPPAPQPVVRAEGRRRLHGVRRLQPAVRDRPLEVGLLRRPAARRSAPRLGLGTARTVPRGAASPGGARGSSMSPVRGASRTIARSVPRRLPTNGSATSVHRRQPRLTSS